MNSGGPHGQANATADIDNSAMDGFIGQVRKAKRACADLHNRDCAAGEGTDVMGYHDGGDIPNYWAYAKNFVLQDRMFEPNASWSLPEHLFQVSEWSAHCTTHDQPSSCVNALQNPGRPPAIYAWTDLTYLPHRAAVSWGYYVVAGNEPDILCQRMASSRGRSRAHLVRVLLGLPGADGWVRTDANYHITRRRKDYQGDAGLVT